MRVATGTPTSMKNFSCPAGEQMQSRRAAAVRRVMKLVRSVGGDVQGFAGVRGRLLAAEGGFDLSFEDDERFFEVVAMGRRSSAGGDVHIDDAEASVGLLASYGDGVGVADESDVWEVVGLRQGEAPRGVIRWKGRWGGRHFLSPRFSCCCCRSDSRSSSGSRVKHQFIERPQLC